MTVNRLQAPHKYPAGYDDSCSEEEFPQKKFDSELAHVEVDACWSQQALDVSQIVVRCQASIFSQSMMLVNVRIRDGPSTFAGVGGTPKYDNSCTRIASCRVATARPAVTHK